MLQQESPEDLEYLRRLHPYDCSDEALVAIKVKSAFHEAGHATACLRHRNQPGFMEIQLNVRGSTLGSAVLGCVANGWAEPSSQETAIAAAAGPIAERRFLGLDPLEHFDTVCPPTSGDHHQLRQSLGPRRSFKSIIRIAAEIIDEDWLVVEAVAETLLVEGWLSYDDAKRIADPIKRANAEGFYEMREALMGMLSPV
jgi:hypothetical protein